MNKLILIAGLACATLAGCATGPDFKTYSSTLSQPKGGESRIWFYRPSKMFGCAVQPIVFINDTPVGKAQPGCFFYADRPPGTYELRCTTEWADIWTDIAKGTSLTLEIADNIEQNATYMSLYLCPFI